MTIKNPKQQRRKKIHQRIRQIIKGTAQRPRLSLYKSNKAFYAQLIDDAQGHTLLALDTRKLGTKNKAHVTKLGQTFTQTAKEKGIQQILFDRSGYLYHGLVKAFSQAMHEAGLPH